MTKDIITVYGTAFKIEDIEFCAWNRLYNPISMKDYDALIVGLRNEKTKSFKMSKEQALAIVDAYELLRDKLRASDKIRLGNVIVCRSYFDNVDRVTLLKDTIYARSAVHGESQFTFNTYEDASAAFDKLQTMLNAANISQ